MLLARRISQTCKLYMDCRNFQYVTRFVFQYDNNVHFGVRFTCGPHPVIIVPNEARADLMARLGLQMNLTTEK